MRPETGRTDLYLHLPTATVVKILLTVLIVWAGLRVWPECIFLLISLLLAVALHPVVTWLERRGLRRGTVITLLAAAMLTLSALLLSIVFTALAEQISKLIRDFPSFRGRLEHRLPANYPILKRVVGEVLSSPPPRRWPPSSSGPSPWEPLPSPPR